MEAFYSEKKFGASGGVEIDDNNNTGSLETHFVDVTKKETITRLGEKVQECHVLFNCAG